MTRKIREEADYAVGRGKPPVHTRFRPGQSGNPRGRPKGSRNLHTIFDEAVNETVVVAENGRQRKMSKLDVIIRQTVNKAAAGDIKHTALVFKQLTELFRDNEARSAEPIYGGQDDEQLLDDLLAQLGAPSGSSEDER